MSWLISLLVIVSLLLHSFFPLLLLSNTLHRKLHFLPKLSPPHKNIEMSVPPSSLSMSSSLNRKAVIAIVATVSIILIGVTIFLFFFCRMYVRRRQKNKIDTSFPQEAAVTSKEFREFGYKVKGLVVDRNGQDVLYVKDLEGKKLKTEFSKVVLKPNCEETIKGDVTVKRPRKCERQEEKTGHRRVEESVQPNEQPLATVSPPPSLTKNITALPPRSTPTPTPTPPPPPPPPPPLLAKKHSTPPPPPPMASGLASSMRPPPAPRGNINSKSSAWGSTAETLKGTSVGHMKLKPLHWDKVIANTDHSMVWNEIIDGSLRFDSEQIEMLFGYTTANCKTAQGNGVLTSTGSSISAPTSHIFILEPRKSQNTAIVLKSIAISRKDFLDALLEGHGLSTDTLEKLTRIAPTQEEVAKILQFRGNPSTLADAESFLYHILKHLPSTFIRINAMLFRSNYDAEILNLKESLQTLELGCKALRTRGLFLKLLEAILKAGNRMNAGTSRGNAQGFNLTALRKLSDVKSTDGKTTLLHFVVEQVARFEGRRCLLNRNRNIEKNDSQGGIKSNLSSDPLTEAQRGEQYLLLGLQALGGLSIEFSNVKKAATIEYDSFINICPSLTTRIKEIRLLIANCNNHDGDNFVREMKGFLEECEEELKVVEEEQTRILELVNRTTEYYQAEASKHERSCPLQLFVIVNDFLDMVDQVCINISQRMKKKNVAASPGSASPPSQTTRSPMTLPESRLHLISDASWTPSSSESDDDFSG